MINVKNLSKTYVSYERGEGFIEAVRSLFVRKKKVFRAVDKISLNIKKGEVVGFIGPNGAGKSTTIKILSGVLYPDSGTVDVAGFVPWLDRKKYVANIGVVFGQKSQLFWDLPPIDSFYLNRAIYKISQKKFERRLAELVRLLKIENVMKRPTRQLSLGERMRCEFVIAMLHSPSIVFLDEPTIGLDVFAKATIRDFILKANKKFQTTFIVTSHDLEDIERICERAIIINKGKIIFDGSIRKLKTSNRKYLNIKFRDPVDIKQLGKIDCVKILNKFSEYDVRIMVESDLTADALIKKIRLGNRIEDLEISKPPIEEVIKKVYNSSKP